MDRLAAKNLALPLELELSLWRIALLKQERAGTECDVRALRRIRWHIADLERRLVKLYQPVLDARMLK